jgi:putative peptidoglycan lipid II flippase
MLSLAILLNNKRMVRIAGLEWNELAKSLLASLFGGVATMFTLRHLPLGATHTANVLRLLVGGTVWFVVISAILLLTRSALPAVVLRRKAKPAPSTVPVMETSDAPDR